MYNNVVILQLLALIVTVAILTFALVKISEKENFTASYDPNCIRTCKSQSTNADDQCMSDCQAPCNNKCWEDCFRKSAYFDDYLRCGQRCPYGYFTST
jgi:hypothetical protein